MARYPSKTVDVAARDAAVLAVIANKHSVVPPPLTRAKKKKAPPKRSPVKDAERMEAAREVARGLMAKGQFGGCDPFLFVALFVELHERIYKVPPMELVAGNKVGAAVKMVKTMLAEHFEGDQTLFAEYMRWAFVREERRVKRDPVKAERRISWVTMFQPSWLLTDYYAATKAPK